jgi:hypothetical protein
MSINGSTGGIITLQANGTQKLRLFTGASSNVGTLAGALDISTGDASALTFGTNSAERMRIDSSGNVGIGVTPQTWTVYKPLSIAGVGQNVAASGGAGELQLTANCYYNGGWKYATTQKTGRFAVGEGYNDFKWFQAASGTADTAVSFTQAMTLDTSGNLLVGTTAAVSSTRSGTQVVPSGGINISCGAVTTLSYLMAFINGNGTVGNINVNGSATAYATSSDYRLKNTIAPMTGALAKVALLKPVTYKWNSDGSSGEGFIAHELQAIVPDCVTGEKDAVETYTDEDGNEQTRPAYQGIDTSFLVATLTAAIQEQQALITQLQADVAALKGA